MEEDYCQVFLDASLEKHLLLNKVAEILNGVVNRRTVISSYCEVDVFNNDEYVDVFQTEASSLEEFRETVCLLVNELRKGGRVVAACDFEDLLSTDFDSSTTHHIDESSS